jgi:hypothetical protein
MANRAYLYSSDCNGAEDPSDWEELDRNSDSPYYESRWTLPTAWLFFYRSSDIRAIYKHGYLEITLTALKSEALSTFEARMPLLQEVLQKTGAAFESDTLLCNFINNVRGWEGKYLLLAPDAVNQMSEAESDEEELDCWQRILGLLDRSDMAASALIDAAPWFWRIRYADDAEFRRHIIGSYVIVQRQE